MEVIWAKTRSEKVGVVPTRAKERVMSLADALEKSIERAKKEQAETLQPRKQDPKAGRGSV